MRYEIPQAKMQENQQQQLLIALGTEGNTIRVSTNITSNQTTQLEDDHAETVLYKH